MATYLHATIVLAFVATSVSATAQETSRKPDAGQIEFQTSCASCHGAAGKGDGPVAAQLRTAPPDLTVLAKNNGGVFPFAKVYDVIEGADVAAHGTREMPVWGWEYKVQAGEYSHEVRTSREAVQRRILTLLEHLNRLQQK
ncbi:MAG TPA: c-type cytochrome [Noviherbaspirillum sp.]